MLQDSCEEPYHTNSHVLVLNSSTHNSICGNTNILIIITELLLLPETIGWILLSYELRLNLPENDLNNSNKFISMKFLFSRRKL